MAVANTLAYFDMATITAEKSFLVQAPGEPNDVCTSTTVVNSLP
jgi:hypothetical protein